MMKGTGTAERLRGKGIAVSVNPGKNAVALSLLPRAEPLAAREILYKALNGLEPDFTVSLKGLPFCFMPDAWDHIVRGKKKGAARARIPACRTCRLAEFCPGLEKNSVFFKRLRRELKPVLAAPNEVVIELTKRCNLNCRACFAGRGAAERSLADLTGVLRQAGQMGVKNVRFTGGEPFLSENLLPLLKAAKKMGFYTLVNTNALGADTAALKKAAPHIDNVLVSMQGHDAASESAETGVPGLFSRKLANIRTLKLAGVKTFRLGTVISKDLIEKFPAYHRLASSLEPAIWELYRPMLKNRAPVSGAKFKLRAADIKRLSKLIGNLAPRPRVVIANPVPLCLVPAGETKHFLGAAFDDGHTRVVYDPRGFFKPSYYIEEDLGGELKSAWNSPFLKNLNAARGLPKRCIKCVSYLKCLGGSRFLANEAGGGYFAEDPWLPK